MKFSHVLTLLWLCAAFPATAVHAADITRGKMLYETACTGCHATSVHTRAARKATTFAELRAQVAGRSAPLGLGWRDEEIDDVTLYLNDKYYSFPCPERICKKEQASLNDYPKKP